MNLRNSALRIQQAAIRAVDPISAITSFFQQHNAFLSTHHDIAFVAIGKAATSMAQAMCSLPNIHIEKGIIITKKDHIMDVSFPSNIDIFESGHPVPDETSIHAGKQLLDFLQTSISKGVVFLISGGSSALVTVPHEGITLNDIQQMTKTLLACGATIYEINTIRKHIDQVKGGGLLKHITPGTDSLTLVLSDVIGDDLSVIASGPTYWDISTFDTALAIIDKYKIRTAIPTSIVTCLQQGIEGSLPETLKKEDPLFEHASHFIVGNLKKAVDAASTEAKNLGFDVKLLTYGKQGEAKEVGKEFATTIVDIHRQYNSPTCILFGGETTVTISSTSHGNGGRSQELALSTVNDLSHEHSFLLYSFGTDGTDGPTDAAGAFVDEEIIKQIQQHHIDPTTYLANHDSYSFFKQVNGLIFTGPTGTNVGDITMALLLNES